MDSTIDITIIVYFNDSVMSSANEGMAFMCSEPTCSFYSLNHVF